MPCTTTLRRGGAAVALTLALGLSSILPAGADARPVRGGDAAETLRGSHARDSIYGGGGDDVLYAFRGNDYLVGHGGRDTYYAGPGNDVIDSADGVAESVVCGPGRDRVSADTIDTLFGCEQVSRLAPQAALAPAPVASAVPTPPSTPSAPATIGTEQPLRYAISSTPESILVCNRLYGAWSLSVRQSGFTHVQLYLETLYNGTSGAWTEWGSTDALPLFAQTGFGLPTRGQQAVYVQLAYHNGREWLYWGDWAKVLNARGEHVGKYC